MSSESGRAILNLLNAIGGTKEHQEDICSQASSELNNPQGCKIWGYSNNVKCIFNKKKQSCVLSSGQESIKPINFDKAKKGDVPWGVIWGVVIAVVVIICCLSSSVASVLFNNSTASSASNDSNVSGTPVTTTKRRKKNKVTSE